MQPADPVPAAATQWMTLPAKYCILMTVFSPTGFGFAARCGKKDMEFGPVIQMQHFDG